MKAMAMIPTYNEALNIEPLLREILRQGGRKPENCRPRKRDIDL
jgi:hypothetical protein